MPPNKGRGGGRKRAGAKDASGGRTASVRVRTAKGRKLSSTRWLQRQLNDPYVQEAKRRGYRSRAAFKLIELDEKYRILRPGARIVDLGAAPGGWTQVAAERTGRGGTVVALDIAEMQPLAGAVALTGDFLDPATAEQVRQALAGPADVALSDMAAPATGHAATGHLRSMALPTAAFDFAVQVLVPGGSFVATVLQGRSEGRRGGKK